MHRIAPFSQALATTATLVAALAWGAPAFAQVVGKASAVNPAAHSQHKVIQLGADVIYKERIATSAQGSVQLLFVDKTSLNIGPNSDVVIDEFVYNPNTGSGRMALTLGKGVLRFVGGQTSHTEGATIKTPSATLGVRGGVNMSSVDAVTKLLQTINLFGATSVDANGSVTVISRPGFGMTVGSDGAVSAPFRVPLAMLSQLNAQVTSKPGQGGGSGSKPTEQTAKSSGLGQANAGVSAVNIGPGNFGLNNQSQNTTTQLTQLTQQGSQIQQDQQAQQAQQSQGAKPILLSGFIGGASTSTGQSGPISKDGLFGVAQPVKIDPSQGKVSATFLVFSTAGGSGVFQFDGNCSTTDCSQFSASGNLAGTTIDGRGVISGTLSLATATASDRAQFPGVTFCQCEFTRWGFWTADLTHLDKGTNLEAINARGSWVAGSATALADIPTTGVATYTGHAVGRFDNGSQQYFAAGNFSNTVNFGNHTGTVSIANLDGFNYAGSVGLANGANSFAGSLQAPHGGPAGFLVGQFNGPAAKEMGGGFGVSGGSNPHYFGFGIFAASH